MERINLFKIQGKYIKWIKEFEDCYSAWNNKGEDIGLLKYERVGRYKHWCWYQGQDVRMSPGCLQEIRNIQKILASPRKRQNKEEKG